MILSAVSIKYLMPTCLCALTFFAAFAKPHLSYYISSSGDDSNDGSKKRPFQSIQKLNSLKLKANSSVYLQGGEVFGGPLILEADENGSGNKLITIKSYGKGIAVIDGGLSEAIVINGSYVELSDIHVRGAGRKEGNTSNGILIKGSGWSKISNVIIEGFQKSGIELNNCHDVLLEKIVAKNNGFCGIYLSGTKTSSKNITIRNCSAENNAGDPTNLTNHSGNGILASGSDSVMIEYCTATNNGWDMPRNGNGPVGIWAYDCDHLTIQYCISYKNKTQPGASDGGGFDFDGGMTNSTMQYCLSYENAGSGYGLFQFNGASLWSNNTVRYCISINDGQTTPGAAGFLMWNESADSSGLDDCHIYNNVVYNNSAPAVRFDDKSANTKFIFTNNIFIGKGDIINGASSGEQFIANVWWNIPGNTITFRGYKDLEEWSAATGQESSHGAVKGKQIDPLLTGPFTTDIVDPHLLTSLKGFQLLPSSPLKIEGTDLKATYGIFGPSKDFFGNAIKQSSVIPGIHKLAK